MIGQQIVYDTLAKLDIKFEYYQAGIDYVDEDDHEFWHKIQATRCKNLFMRNHKGNRHFLIIADYYNQIDIRSIEQLLKQGKISFASQERIDKWIKGTIGAISVFSLFNDTSKSIEVFIDEDLRTKSRLSFLPNELKALLAINYVDFIKILDYCGHKYSFLKM